MPICITDKEKCNGCGACKNICPKNCIDMIDDVAGFNYPKVDDNLCINCELCTKVCPEINIKQADKFNKPTVYAAWSKDSEVRYNSTSGGIFSEVAKAILKNGGVIVGAKYNDDNLVEHTLVKDEEGLEAIRQSKYIQSDTKTIYREIKQNLMEGKLVGFCGAPCQVAGLNSFLMKEYKNLITIDFICRGMNSPKAYKYWLEELEEEASSKVERVWFKYKKYGWKKSPKCTRVDFKDGSNRVLNAEENTFMCGYLGPNLYIRQSCGDCLFKGIPRHSDITLADFWGISSELDNDKGTSLVLINSSKGKAVFNQIEEKIECYEREFEEVYNGNVCFKESVSINHKSIEFLSSLGTEPFSKLVKRYTKTPLFKRVLRKLKRCIYKVK